MPTANHSLKTCGGPEAHNHSLKTCGGPEAHNHSLKTCGGPEAHNHSLKTCGGPEAHNHSLKTCGGPEAHNHSLKTCGGPEAHNHRLQITWRRNWLTRAGMQHPENSLGVSSLAPQTSINRHITTHIYVNAHKTNKHGVKRNRRLDQT